MTAGQQDKGHRAREASQPLTGVQPRPPPPDQPAIRTNPPASNVPMSHVPITQENQ